MKTVNDDVYACVFAPSALHLTARSFFKEGGWSFLQSGDAGSGSDEDSEEEEEAFKPDSSDLAPEESESDAYSVRSRLEHLSLGLTTARRRPTRTATRARSAATTTCPILPPATTAAILALRTTGGRRRRPRVRSADQRAILAVAFVPARVPSPCTNIASCARS